MNLLTVLGLRAQATRSSLPVAGSLPSAVLSPSAPDQSDEVCKPTESPVPERIEARTGHELKIKAADHAVTNAAHHESLPQEISLEAEGFRANGDPRNPTSLALLNSPSLSPQKPAGVSTLSLNGLLLPANTGKIKHVLMTCGPASFLYDDYLEAAKSLVDGMPDARFTFLIGIGGDGYRDDEFIAHAKARISKALAGGEPSRDLSRVKIVPAYGHDLSQWAQDGVLVKGNQLLKRDRIAEDYDDAVPALAASALDGYTSGVLSGIEIDGGNQLATPDLLLVGSDAVESVARNIERYPSKFQMISPGDSGTALTETSDTLARRLIQSRFPSQRLIVIGSPDARGRTRQPAFHIDMAITLLKRDRETGKPVAVVGDPSLAKTALSAFRAEDPHGYASVVAELNRKLFNETVDPLEGLRNAVTDEDQKQFDAAADHLEKEGFLVVRIPYLGTEGRPPSWTAWPWITYNNALIDGERVFMPAYQIPILDRMAARIYEQQGYQVIPVDAVGISVGHGALNCITKVLEREIEV